MFFCLDGRDRALHLAAVDRRLRMLGKRLGRRTPTIGRRLRAVATATTAAIYVADPPGRDDEAHGRRPGDPRLSADVRPSHSRLTGPEIAIHFAHRVGALVVVARRAGDSRVTSCITRRDRRELTRPARCCSSLVAMQVTLGALTVLSRRDVWINSLHVVCGALVLTTSLVLTLAELAGRFAERRSACAIASRRGQLQARSSSTRWRPRPSSVATLGQRRGARA